MPVTDPPLLSIHGLHVAYGSDQDDVVQGIGFELHRGRTLALVGESGSGKSTVALAILRVLPRAATLRGAIRFEQTDLIRADRRALRQLHGRRIGCIFQEPSAAMNPAYPVGWQLYETLRLHRPEVENPKAEILDTLDAVGVREPDSRYGNYPHEFSGGMLQRVLIAQTLLAQPDLIIADEPTTALDVTIQAQIMALLGHIRDERHLSMILITHNIGLVQGFADHVLVMRHGRMQEYGPAEQVIRYPVHAYTRGLMACVPRIGDARSRLPEVPA